MNNKGQIIITDLLLYIIVLTIILGLIIFSMTILNDSQVTRINNKQLNNLLDNSLETLTETSGLPSKWEYMDNDDIKTVGLKSDNNNFISYQKLMKLKNNKHLLDSYFPSGVAYELTLYPKNNENSRMLIAGNYLSNQKQVFSKSEIILIDYGYNITSFYKDNNINSCYYNHNKDWTCKPFTISKSLLNEGEYYIITNDNIEYILSNTYSENITQNGKGIININNNLKQLIKNENETIYLHITSHNNDTYLVYDKNNIEEYLNNVIKPEVYILNMKVAI